MRKVLLCAAAVPFGSGLVNVGTPSAEATLCGSVDGRHVDVTGCAGPFSYLNDALPQPPLPNVSVCAEASPHLQRVSGTVRYADTSPAQIIGDGEKHWWDAIIVVEYLSPAAFLDMVTNEEYLKIHDHRANALDRGDLVATSTWTMAD